MPTPLATHTLVLRPDHLILLLRDIDCDAGTGASAAMTQARATIAASSGYGIYVEAAQDAIPLRVTVETWEADPGPGAGDGWTGPVALDLDCPTGQLQVGDDMGNAIDGIIAPHGPGRYHVTVHHHGRHQALEHERQVIAALAPGHDADHIDALSAELEGTERYLFRLWWHGPLPDDEDEA